MNHLLATDYIIDATCSGCEFSQFYISLCSDHYVDLYQETHALYQHSQMYVHTSFQMHTCITHTSMIHSHILYLLYICVHWHTHIQFIPEYYYAYILCTQVHIRIIYTQLRTCTDTYMYRCTQYTVCMSRTLALT